MPLWDEGEWEYCNGWVSGNTWRWQHGDIDCKVLEVLQPVTFGARVIPDDEGKGSSGDLVYTRARFERVVRSNDMEVFYMIEEEDEGNNLGEVATIVATASAADVGLNVVGVLRWQDTEDLVFGDWDHVSPRQRLGLFNKGNREQGLSDRDADVDSVGTATIFSTALVRPKIYPIFSRGSSL
ncbi:hypothetical protein COCNU_02G011900 [Cocos nucifera]|uniref:Uncharacterized protein n=1 Tax=Cocos nucifera TaxID=13894 RepID=A0A8K0MX87_COCNU|nr:hypothetical protein COCNU_02G011900 [Cocos nucifera]